MPWWSWVIVGFLILVTELFMPSGFFLLFIGSSFILTGIIVSTGLISTAWLQWIVCSVLAVVLMVALRRRVVSRFLSSNLPEPEGTVGSEVVIVADIAPGQIGKGQMRGIDWSVRNVGTAAAKAGETCLVSGVRGVTLEIDRT